MPTSQPLVDAIGCGFTRGSRIRFPKDLCSLAQIARQKLRYSVESETHILGAWKLVFPRTGRSPREPRCFTWERRISYGTRRHYLRIRHRACELRQQRLRVAEG